MIRVADYIMERLYADGAKHIFMVTGRGALFLSDAVAAHKELTGVSVHHEQAAAYAAVAYAQYTIAHLQLPSSEASMWRPQ